MAAVWTLHESPSRCVLVKGTALRGTTAPTGPAARDGVRGHGYGDVFLPRLRGPVRRSPLAVVLRSPVHAQRAAIAASRVPVQPLPGFAHCDPVGFVPVVGTNAPANLGRRWVRWPCHSVALHMVNARRLGFACVCFAWRGVSRCGHEGECRP